MPSEPTPKTDKRCTVPSCGKPLRTKGFCTGCYYRHLRYGSTEPVDRRKWKHILSNIDPIAQMADCKTCGRVKIVNRGRMKKDKHKGKSWKCSTDARARARDYKRAYRASKLVMMEDHCEICNKKEDLCWDHCHTSESFRGTLCGNCNAGIGMFKDSTDLLSKAIEYLIVKRAPIQTT